MNIQKTSSENRYESDEFVIIEYVESGKSTTYKLIWKRASEAASVGFALRADSLHNLKTFLTEFITSFDVPEVKPEPTPEMNPIHRRKTF